MLWLFENGSGGSNFHTLSEEDLPQIMPHRATKIASDGGISEFGVGVPHPRTFGTFARVLGVGDRGALRPRMKANISFFDPMTVKYVATYEKPHQYAVGVEVRRVT